MTGQLGVLEPVFDNGRTRVWRSHDPDRGGFIHKEALGEWALERIAHEASILRRLDGVSGVPLLRPSRDARVLVTADSGARVLAEVLAERRLRLGEVLDIGEELARILAAVHAAGVAHLDLHPWNVLLAADGGVELIDFDLATTMAEVRPGFTHHREIRGRLPYLSPEQTGRTASAVDRRSDLYALGAVLYEAATGRPPFAELDAFELVREILTRAPVPPSRLEPMLPPALDAVIARLLAKEPDRRYQSAAGAAHDLARIRARPGAMFPAGERDFPSRLSPPTRLVGREAETAVLAEALQAVVRSSDAAAGGPPPCRVVTVCGDPGVGKSALISTLRPLVTRYGGWFVAGKADQVASDSSAGLPAALRRLARLLLAESPADLEAQARELRERLGSNAAALIAIAPEFGTVLGRHGSPEVAELERENRTRQAVIELLRTVASAARPVVLVLDDIQWAPPSSLGLLEAIVDDPVLDGLLLVGAYRDAEVEGSQLAAMMAGWVRRGVAPMPLRLSPLRPDDVTTLLGQVLRLPAERAASLADVVGERTAGNPFDTVELLNSLRESGALELVDGGWTWDMSAIRDRSGDVGAWLTRRIEGFGPDVAQLLDGLAFLGGGVSTADLATACGWTPTHVAGLLTGPLETGLVIPVRHGHPGAAELRFRHDRVQQAALERLGGDRRRSVQATMGRRLAAAGRDLPAARQLLAADVAPQAADERRMLVRLYRAAADHERRQTDFTSAERYLAVAARLLRDGSSPAAGRAWFDVESERHQVLFQLGRFAEADEVYAALGAAVPDPLELARVTGIQVASLTKRNEFGAAVELGLDVMGRLGMRYPDHDVAAEVARGLAEVAAWTSGLDPVVDASRPALSDPTAAALAAIMNPLSVPAFFAAPLVSGWLVDQARRLWEAHGPSEDLITVLGHGPGAFVAVLGEYRPGRTLLTHLIAVGEAHRWERPVAYTRFLHAICSAHWFEPLDAATVVARTARDRLLHIGDLSQACWSYVPVVVNTFETAPSLDHAMGEAAAGLALADRTGTGVLQHCFAIVHGFCRAAQTGASAPDPEPAVGEPGAEALADAVPAVGAYLRLFRSISAALLDDGDLLAAHSRTAHRQAQQLPGTVLALISTVPFGLDLCRQLRRRSPADPAHAALLAEFDRLLDWLRHRAHDQPDNAAHLVHHLEAERAWALGNHDGAAVSFDAALFAVQRLSRPWHRALLARRAGELHRERGREHTGRLHLAEARRTLLDWGADALAAALERRYPFLRDQSARRPGVSSVPISSTSSASRITFDAVDTTAVLRVAQALAEQTTLAQLHRAVVDQLSAVTGATAVALVLPDGDAGWRIHADGRGDRALDDATQLLPVSAVRYVLRTRETLSVDDATTDERFTRDPYLQARRRLALLVVPVLRAGRLRAVLVLENHLTSDTFTPDRLGFVDLLTGQLAVALDNATLYASLERRIAERTEELRAANAQLELLSMTDALTGVANRRRFDAALAAEWVRVPGRSLAVIMVDVDHFKKYNDHLGHPAGDACLIEVSRLLAGALREADLLCRYGGEEFAVVLSGTDLDTAAAVAERMRTAVHAAGLPHDPAVGFLTVSIGVAAVAPAPATSPTAVVIAADAALYEAKHSGRNCVRTGTPS